MRLIQFIKICVLEGGRGCQCSVWYHSHTEPERFRLVINQIDNTSPMSRGGQLVPGPHKRTQSSDISEEENGHSSL